MKVSSSLSGTTSLSPVPEGIYSAHIDEKKDSESQNGNPMCTLTWMIDEGEFAGRRIPYQNVMLGGETKDGKPMPLFTLCALLEAAEIPWSCGLCNSEESPRIFDRGDGVTASKDQYVCPICKGSGDIRTDTDYFPGAKCNIRVIVERNLKGDRDINSIVGYLHP